MPQANHSSIVCAARYRFSFEVVKRGERQSPADKTQMEAHMRMTALAAMLFVAVPASVTGRRRPIKYPSAL
jgi:hypothetical protein